MIPTEKELTKSLKNLEQEWESKESQESNSQTSQLPNDFIEFNSDNFLGLPIHPIWHKPTGIPKFQRDYYDNIKRHKHYAVVKTTGGGITEITARMMLHAAYTWKDIYLNQFAILNGTKMDEASVILGRIKDIILRNQPWMLKKSSYDILTLSNDKYFKVYPAMHIDAIRSQPDIAFIFVDEAAFFETKLEKHFNIRNAVERYIEKLDPWILWVSTPNGPQGVFYEIIEEARHGGGPYGYDYMEINYLMARELLLDKYIERMKAEKPLTFDQEFNCKFIAPVSAMTPQDWIEKATQEEYELTS